MAEITRIFAENIRGQIFFVITTRASTRCLVEIFQLIFCSQRANATSQQKDSGSSSCSKWPKRLDGCNDETLLAPCTRKKRLQRKMTKDYY